MTRAELVDQISLKFPDLQLKDIDAAVRVVLDAMSNTLAQGGG